MAEQPIKKSEETKSRILEAALHTFRKRGFDGATMREIAAKAEVAVGAAYYYFDSKDAIVMAFYQRAQREMEGDLEQILNDSRSLEERLAGIITHKLKYFNANRALLGALSSHIDPNHPLSPFSEETRTIRDEDVAFFVRAVADSKVKLPRNVQPYLPRLLWMYQMGIILFWVYDKSPKQQKTGVLLEKTLTMLVVTLGIAGLPILRPLHRLAGDLLEVIYGKV